MAQSSESAIFAAGCFWGVEYRFQQLPGVLQTQVGYIGGTTEHPSYQDVCRKDTGHAEAVEVVFDTQAITYEALVEAFFAMHDPTQLNRQGPDVGDQYRSAVFFHSPEQEATAHAVLERSRSRHSKPIATVVVPATTFWPAEEYHQKYLEKRGASSCHL